MMMMADVLFSMSLLQVHDNKCFQIQVCMPMYLLDAIYHQASDWPDAFYGGCASYAYCKYYYTQYILLLLIKTTLIR